MTKTHCCLECIKYNPKCRETLIFCPDGWKMCGVTRKCKYIVCDTCPSYQQKNEIEEWFY